jgi:putative RNA 2'-phosphotransferase
MDVVKVSKFLSFILRHKPESIGLKLDANGWANVDDIIRLSAKDKRNPQLTKDIIYVTVQTNDKQRFILTKDLTQIRANQGHSVKVDLQLQSTTPPDVLYHGTATRFLDSINKQGLLPQDRQYVHLSSTIDTATKVGKRHGQLAIIVIDAKTMYNNGYLFYVTVNGVWLTNTVPTQFFYEILQ